MIKQFWTVIGLGLATLPGRKGSSLVIVIGMICAVGALVSIKSMSAGLDLQMSNNGRADRAIVISRNALTEFSSSVPKDSVPIIADAPGIKHTQGGQPIISPEAMAGVPVTKKGDGLSVFVIVFGLGPQSLALWPEIKLISGRMFRPGKFELIVGKEAAAEFGGLTENSRVSLPDGDWTIVGTFESNGGGNESALMTDSDTLLASLRGSAYKGVRVMLNAPDQFNAFRDALTGNPALAVDVKRETDYNAESARSLTGLLTAVEDVVGAIMGLGAMFGALNTMYSAVGARAVEIATLRAIGFSGAAVMASVLVEALLLALAGSLIGSALAWAAFNGNAHIFGGDVIHLAVTPGLIGTGALFACVLGLVGGFFPALRAARRPVAEALRAT